MLLQLVIVDVIVFFVLLQFVCGFGDILRMTLNTSSNFFVISLESFDLSLEILKLTLAVFIEFFGKEGLPHDVVELCAKSISFSLDFLDFFSNVLYLLTGGGSFSVSLLECNFFLSQIVVLVQQRPVLLFSGQKHVSFVVIVRIMCHHFLSGFDQFDVKLPLLLVQVLGVSSIAGLVLHILYLMAQSLNLSV